MKQERIIFVVTDGRDYSVKEVSEWLLYLSKLYHFKLVVLDISRHKLILKKGEIGAQSDLLFGITDSDIEFTLSSVHAVFFRQASLRIEGHTGATSNSGSPSDISSRISNYLMAYEANIRWLILNCLSTCNTIGYDSGSFINKLDALKKAAEVGLSIPLTILTSYRSDLVNFIHKNGTAIVKSPAINLSFFDLEARLHFRQLTHSVAQKNLEEIPSTFNLSLIQQRIDKLFEIRVFYLDKNCHSWALLSQSNQQTQVDYRNYDWNNPMRVVPFTLPKAIESKIILLMETLQLRTGSIDLIYTFSHEYVFLEVNPAGQYGYNSDASNYNLNKQLAQSLLFKHEKEKHRTFHS